MPQVQVKELIAMLDEAYAGPAWHGPCLRQSLRGVTPRAAARRPGRGRHNIWELAVHATYWKYVAIRRILGETELRFGEPGHNFFERPAKGAGASEQAALWRRDLARLARMHKELRKAVGSLEDSLLDRRARGGRHTNRVLIAGEAMHDVYHAGQIQLLKRLNAK
ncbi:MAG TPA: DinB family protein [Candidatus Acidoferrales bacterium]|nr:DinB family protein [Candidatus Acidoferrales bacterium]